METPDPVRSPKLSNHGRVQYSGGGPPGKRTYCTVFSIISSSESSEVRTTHPSTHTWAQKNTWAKSRHSPSTGLGRILFSRPSSPRCLTHIHVGVGFDRVGLRNRCSLNWAGSGLPRVCGFNSHSASSNCVYFKPTLSIPPHLPPSFTLSPQ